MVDTAKEHMGWEKRDILVTHVKDARDDQDEAKQQFQTTLQEFQAITHFNGGNLEDEYKKLNSEYETCEKRAQAVSDQIDAVDRTANKMFTEWNAELSQYSDPDLRRSSEAKLGETKQRYAKLLGVMRKAEASMKPVLVVFHDRVLYMKHNLNAAAIASLQDTSGKINDDVTKLISDMQASINEADTFIGQMK
jgi:predicted  nucleic acid-binding Zn-ribbon protein